MKAIAKVMSSLAGLAACATLLAPAATAGCGDTAKLYGPFEFVQPQWNMEFAAQNAQASRLSPESARDVGSGSIVGMWSVQFISRGNTTHNPSIPDGAIVDFGYTQWHSDGTEILNSGGRAPATENFCLGVWRRTGYSTYQLSHFALSYDAVTGELNGKVNIQETVTLSPGGTKYSGTFTIDVFDPKGNHVDHVAGDLAAIRLTVDSTTP